MAQLPCIGLCNHVLTYLLGTVPYILTMGYLVGDHRQKKNINLVVIAPNGLNKLLVWPTPLAMEHWDTLFQKPPQTKKEYL